MEKLDPWTLFCHFRYTNQPLKQGPTIFELDPVQKREKQAGFVAVNAYDALSCTHASAARKADRLAVASTANSAGQVRINGKPGQAQRPHMPVAPLVAIEGRLFSR